MTTNEFDLAFERAYRSHAADVLAYCLRRTDAATAEDIAAETFTVAWRRRAILPSESLPWLLAVARRVLANHYRATKRGAELITQLGANAVAATQQLDESPPVLAALARLTEAEQEVLLLPAWEGLATAQAAEVVGCSAVAFRLRAMRARRRLRQALAELNQQDEPTPRATSTQHKAITAKEPW